MTEAMEQHAWLRVYVNRRATIVGLVVAIAARGDCAPAPNGLIVCGGAANPGGGGTTIGDVFVTERPTQDVLDNNTGLVDHELKHSAQWAGWGGQLLYVAAYGTAMGYSQLRTGNYACANYFEWAADFEQGGYDTCAH